MSDHLDSERLKCEPCRTINLANIKYPKPNMQLYDKCSPTKKITCARVSEPVRPTFINVCNSYEQNLNKSGKKIALPNLTTPYAHGKLMYAVKAGILVGAVYFTYKQGVWGDQQDASECIRRWQEYIRSINTRRPPAFDHCGNVIRQESSEGLLAPLYSLYKSIVTTCFSGVVKIPHIVKCAYIDYKKALDKKDAEVEKDRKLKK